jgi:hypothetical protein
MNLNIAPSAQDVYFDVQVNPQRVELNPPEVKLGASAAPPHDCQDFLHWLLRGSRRTFSYLLEPRRRRRHPRIGQRQQQAHRDGHHHHLRHPDPGVRLQAGQQGLLLIYVFLNAPCGVNLQIEFCLVAAAYLCAPSFLCVLE